MRRYLIPVTAAVAFAFAAPASADQLMTGDIASFDPEAGTFSLRNGVQFHLAEGVEDPGLAVGEDVEFIWDYDGERRVVTEVKLLDGLTPTLR